MPIRRNAIMRETWAVKVIEYRANSSKTWLMFLDLLFKKCPLKVNCNAP